jgi:threonine/homoserine/homoserine lactone efflux protein
MLLEFFLKGVAAGTVIGLPVGPVGVLCLRRTLVEGRLAGLVSGLGAAAGDTFFGIVAAFGLGFVSNWLLGWRPWLTAGGACFLLVLGARAIFAEPMGDAERYDRENLLGDFVSTFVLTLANPITLLAFLGIFAAVGFGAPHPALGDAAMLVSGVFIGSLAWWLALAVWGGRFLSALRPRERKRINRGAGGLLLLAGVGLLIALARYHIG